MKAAQFLTRILGSTLAIAALASGAQAATLKSMECTAYNMYGVAQMSLDPETQLVTSVINFGQLELHYRVAGVEATNQPIEGYAASGAGIELQSDALTQTAGHYKLLFSEDLKIGEKQYVSGQLIHYTRHESKADHDHPSTLPADIVTPISLVNCTLELGL